MDSKVKEVLVKARSKIEQGWCQGASARGRGGRTDVACADDAAREWCALGAILAVCGPGPEYQFVDAFMVNAGVQHITVWNDRPGRTQAEVLAAFDRAIEACK